MVENKKQIIFLVLIAICMFLFVYAIVTLIINKDVIVNDPLIYGMKVHNFTSCSCFDGSGDHWESTEEGFIKR